MTTPTEVLRRVNRLIAETDAVYHKIALSYGISDSILMILYVLCAHDGRCPVFTLRREVELSKQTVHSALQKMEKDGLITVSQTEDNRKTREVCLTSAGRAFCEKTAGRLIEAENRIFSSFSDADLSAYFYVSEQFLKQLQNEQKKEIL